MLLIYWQFVPVGYADHAFVSDAVCCFQQPQWFDLVSQKKIWNLPPFCTSIGNLTFLIFPQCNFLTWTCQYVHIILSISWILELFIKKMLTRKSSIVFFSPRIAPWACVVKISLSALVVIFCPHIHWAPWTKVVGWWSLGLQWMDVFGSIPKVLDSPSPFRWKHTPDLPMWPSDTPKFWASPKRCQNLTPHAWHLKDFFRDV